MQIDTNALIKDITLLEDYIKKYDDNFNEMFNELFKINEYYSENDSSELNKRINNMNSNNIMVLDILNKIVCFYKDVYNMYDNIKEENDV